MSAARRLADLLIINGDPIKDITVLQNRDNLDVVMKDGKLVECNLTPANPSPRPPNLNSFGKQTRS